MDHELPTYMWVVTRARTRAGKAPLKIAPVGYEHAYRGDKPVWVRTVSQRGYKEKLYSLTECYGTPVAAVAAMNALMKLELFREQGKLNKLRGKFAEARLAAKECFIKSQN